MSHPTPSKKRGGAAGWIVFAVCVVGAFGLGLLATSISERRNESVQARVQFSQPIAEWESDNAKWGASFPREYNSWELTKNDDEKTEFGGSGFRDYLEENPNLVVMWAGYAFAKEFNQARGHYWAVDDVKKTARRSETTPATCWTCKSPDVPRIMARDGVAEYYKAPFDKFEHEVTNSIGCADCHNNETMALQISRPALKEAFERQGKDIAKVSHQEMRSLVCAQCHVEYYFKGKDAKYLTFPWDKGTKADDMEKYYAESDHVDWTHSISGAKMIKMQHPDFEVYSQGIHAARGVSCADCHMPYKSEGGIKFTDHQVRSPLLNVANSCQVCHRWSEKDIKDRVTGIQTTNRQIMVRAETAITALHLEIGHAMTLGATGVELEAARKKVSTAQLYWDYIAATNGMGFHAPQESARVLAKALETAADGRLEIARVRARHGAIDALPLPDISTKAKAQSYIKPFVDKQKAAPASAAPKKVTP